ncbi:MAG: hypothetical protein Q4P24_17725, partial [Rhodobacterales bacterium]|nr:hypothetical protein [Rhodobacterales bacterium]
WHNDAVGGAVTSSEPLQFGRPNKNIACCQCDFHPCAGLSLFPESYRFRDNLKYDFAAQKTTARAA